MKELSIKDKAKRYDEAIKVAQRFYNNSVAITKKGLEEMFPELKESEDERIRKAIKKALQVRCDGSRIISDEPVTLEEAIAWLEKQGEQKNVNEIAKEVCKNKTSAMAFLKSAGIINEKGELAEQYRQDEQKPTSWSEEDEDYRLNANVAIVDFFDNEYAGALRDWLKSLKDRVQPKQEWSEEDEKMCNDTIQFIEKGWTDNGKSHLIPWLKSLKPQNTWKPSDEQMSALRVLSLNCESQKQFDIIGELIEQLKVLQDDTKSS